MKTDILIIGGSAAGVTAAITARRFHPDHRITLIRRENKVLVPCGIPYIFGTLDSIDENVIPDGVLKKHDVELIIDDVSEIDRESRRVLTGGSGEIEYDRLILATGSKPLAPPLPGIGMEGVYLVNKDADYLQGLKDALLKAGEVVIIGGGFIGLEFADELSKQPQLKKVTVVESLSHCLLLACDAEISVKVEAELEKRGIEILPHHKATALKGNGKVESVELDDGDSLKADVVILGIGVTPNVKLAKNAGLEVDEVGGIEVDDCMRTSDPNIFAAGDCVMKHDFLIGKTSHLRLASVATMESRVAAANLYRRRRYARQPIGVFSTMIGDLSVGSAGFTERTAEEEGIEIVVGQSTAVDKHPGSLPGAEELTVKLIFMKDSMKLIGGQTYGSDKAGYMINCIGSLIQSNMRADDIAVFQMGTHPKLTASPIAHQLENAAEDALVKIRRG